MREKRIRIYHYELTEAERRAVDLALERQRAAEQVGKAITQAHVDLGWPWLP